MAMASVHEDVWDHAIIGGGAAGGAAALTLARAGRSVVVVEGKAFPRAKVCGEFISPAATGTLEELLEPRELLAAGAHRVDRMTLQLGGRERHWAMPAPAWVLSRRALDAVLLNAARDVGAVVHQPMRVARVAYPEDGREPVAVALSDGSTLRARMVLHADGIGRHDLAGPTPMRPGVVGMKCHLRVPVGMAASGLGMRGARGVYLGTVGIESSEHTAALVCRADLLRLHRADADAMVATLWSGYDAAWRTTDWMSCGVAGSGYIMPGDMRSFRVGNAAAAVEPVGGEGIGLALWSAATLSALLLGKGDGWARPDSLAAIQQEFAGAYRTRLRWRLPACRAAAEVMMRPALLATLWPLLAAPVLGEAMLRPWYAMTGKPLRVLAMKS